MTPTDQINMLRDAPIPVWELFSDGWDGVDELDSDWLQTLPIGTRLYYITHPAPEAASTMSLQDEKPATQSAAGGSVDCDEFKRLVNEYRNECELVQGHGVPAWRKLVAFVNAWHAAHIAANKPAGNAEKGVYWFECLSKCATMLEIDDETPIPSGVVAAVEKLMGKPAAASGESVDPSHPQFVAGFKAGRLRGVADANRAASGAALKGE